MQTTILTPSSVRLARITASDPLPEGADIQKAIYSSSTGLKRAGSVTLSLLLLGFLWYNLYRERQRGNRT